MAYRSTVARVMWWVTSDQRGGRWPLSRRVASVLSRLADGWSRRPIAPRVSSPAGWRWARRLVAFNAHRSCASALAVATASAWHAFSARFSVRCGLFRTTLLLRNIARMSFTIPRYLLIFVWRYLFDDSLKTILFNEFAVYVYIGTWPDVWIVSWVSRVFKE